MGFIKDSFLGKAASDASNAQQRGAREASDIVAQTTAQARQDLQPFTEAGKAALPDLTQAVNADDGLLNEFLAGTAEPQGQTQGTNALLNLILNDPNQLQRFISEGGGQNRTLSQLRDLVTSPRDLAFERREGFDDIASLAKARGGITGGTLRDLVSFDRNLEQQDEQRRVGNLFGLAGLEDRLRGSRLGELLTGRNQRINELGTASDAEQSVRDENLNRLLTRFGVGEGARQTRLGNIFDLVGVGLRGATGQADVAVRGGENRAGLRNDEANAKAAGQVGKANARAGTIFDLASLATGGAGKSFGSLLTGIIKPKTPAAGVGRVV